MYNNSQQQNVARAPAPSKGHEDIRDLRVRQRDGKTIITIHDLIDFIKSGLTNHQKGYVAKVLQNNYCFPPPNDEIFYKNVEHQKPVRTTGYEEAFLDELKVCMGNDKHETIFCGDAWTAKRFFRVWMKHYGNRAGHAYHIRAEQAKRLEDALDGQLRLRNVLRAWEDDPMENAEIILKSDADFAEYGEVSSTHSERRHKRRTFDMENPRSKRLKARNNNKKDSNDFLPTERGTSVLDMLKKELPSEDSDGSTESSESEAGLTNSSEEDYCPDDDDKDVEDNRHAVVAVQETKPLRVVEKKRSRNQFSKNFLANVAKKRKKSDRVVPQPKSPNSLPSPERMEELDDPKKLQNFDFTTNDGAKFNQFAEEIGLAGANKPMCTQKDDISTIEQMLNHISRVRLVCDAFEEYAKMYQEAMKTDNVNIKQGYEMCEPIIVQEYKKARF